MKVAEDMQVKGVSSALREGVDEAPIGGSGWRHTSS